MARQQETEGALLTTMLRPSLVMTEMTSVEAGGEHQTEEDREAKKSYGWSIWGYSRSTSGSSAGPPDAICALPREGIRDRRSRKRRLLAPQSRVPCLVLAGESWIDGCGTGRQNPSPSLFLFSFESSTEAWRLSPFPLSAGPTY